MKKGSITIITIIVISSFILTSIGLVDFSRYNLLKNKSKKILKINSDNVLSEYNEILYNKYNLYGYDFKRINSNDILNDINNNLNEKIYNVKNIKLEIFPMNGYFDIEDLKYNIVKNNSKDFAINSMSIFSKNILNVSSIVDIKNITNKYLNTVKKLSIIQNQQSKILNLKEELLDIANFIDSIGYLNIINEKKIIEENLNDYDYEYRREVLYNYSKIQNFITKYNKIYDYILKLKTDIISYIDLCKNSINEIEKFSDNEYAIKIKENLYNSIDEYNLLIIDIERLILDINQRKNILKNNVENDYILEEFVNQILLKDMYSSNDNNINLFKIFKLMKKIISSGILYDYKNYDLTLENFKDVMISNKENDFYKNEFYSEIDKYVNYYQEESYKIEEEIEKKSEEIDKYVNYYQEQGYKIEEEIQEKLEEIDKYINYYQEQGYKLDENSKEKLEEIDRYINYYQEQGYKLSEELETRLEEIDRYINYYQEQDYKLSEESETRLEEIDKYINYYQERVYKLDDEEDIELYINEKYFENTLEKYDENLLKNNLDKLVLIDYILNYFTSNYDYDRKLDKKISEISKNPLFTSEIEYILFGDENIKSNLKKIDYSIYSLRLACNMASIIMLKSNELNKMATIISSSTFNLSYPIIYNVIWLSWAMIESNIDLELLHNNKKVELLKNKDLYFDLNSQNFTKLSNLLDEIDIDKIEEKDNFSLDYKSYLVIFLNLLDENLILKRIEDVINIDFKSNNIDINIAKLSSSVKSKLSFDVKYFISNIIPNIKEEYFISY